MTEVKLSPVAHLVGSWLVAAVTTDNTRDRKLVTLAGIIPDADGLGIVVDVARSVATGEPATYHFYQQHHHLLVDAVFVGVLQGWKRRVLPKVRST